MLSSPSLRRSLRTAGVLTFLLVSVPCLAAQGSGSGSGETGTSGEAGAGKEPKPAAPDFEHDVLPILLSRCIECHGPDEQEADLRVDRRLSVVGNDEVYGVVVGGSIRDSLLYERVTLPDGDEERMPPRGPRLTEAQVRTLHDWIVTGADWPESVVPKVLSKEELTRPEWTIAPLDEAAAARVTAAVETVRELGGRAGRVADSDPAVEVDYGLTRPAVEAPAVAALAGLEPVLVWFRAPGSALTDEDVARLAAFRQLRKVDLSRTGVTTKAVESLAALPELRVLNLYGCKDVDDRVCDVLTKMPRLEKVFLWQTGVTVERARKLQQARPELVVNIGASLEQPDEKPDERAGEKADAKAGAEADGDDASAQGKKPGAEVKGEPGATKNGTVAAAFGGSGAPRPIAGARDSGLVLLLPQFRFPLSLDVRFPMLRERTDERRTFQYSLSSSR